ncbi:TauD/TfdA family dioxygenase [Legionella spiritensis]|uniref:Pyoverdine biosynthesis protein PvcB n=1 Tax=Legionella spiritensis TaxID=452 RepID=A0A0W0YZ51_LEGSP|nr:TauD/TfdA family dioxygenase [Legionella spiritensis]KTD61934.1 pyoverdine biosynthesis protein PvcB [Legionella spiritensis]SNV31029.1 pyoverdine biosynthesis protein PvcB [Legionella spiritensis]
MNSPTMIRAFEPWLIENRSQAPVTGWPLETLLNLATRHKIVLLRGFAPLEREELLDYCQSHARLLHWDFGPVMEMKVDKETRNYLFTQGDVPLHWDGAFYEEPRFLLFHCLQAPTAGSGGETLFVNTESVWQEATTGQRQEWQALSLSFQTDKLAHYGGFITRKLVNRHPDTNHTIIRFAEPVGDDYLNPVQVKVIDKSDRESAAFLQSLSTIMRAPQHCYSHQWQEGDFLIADNFSLLHGRNSFHHHTPRHLRRIQIL